MIRQTSTDTYRYAWEKDRKYMENRYMYLYKRHIKFVYLNPLLNNLKQRLSEIIKWELISYLVNTSDEENCYEKAHFLFRMILERKHTERPSAGIRISKIQENIKISICQRKIYEAEKYDQSRFEIVRGFLLKGLLDGSRLTQRGYC